MKLRLKKIVLSAMVCMSFSTAVSQWVKKPEFDKNKPAMSTLQVDTVGATPPETTVDKKAARVKILKQDHYYFDYPHKTIGVRFTASPTGKKSEVYEGNHWGTVTGKSYKSILIDGDGGVEFSALNVTEANAKDFRYHVVQKDDKELVSWTKPTAFRKTADGKATYAYLGKFDYSPDQVLKIEIYNVNNYSDLDAVVVDWSKPKKPEIFSSIDYFSTRFSRIEGELSGKILTVKEQKNEVYFDQVKRKYSSRPVSVKDFIETTEPSDIKFRADDSVKNISFKITNGNINHSYKVQLEKVVDNGKETIQLPQTNGSVDVNREFWKTPGKYTITFTPRLQKHGGRPVYLLNGLATKISFTVLPSEKKDMPLKTFIAIIAILMTAAAINFTLFRNRQKRKLAQEAQNRQIASLQLQSVRAQLNPHFIFNALAGIQNLMNKNAIEDANKYLTRFARLTRNVLDDSQKDLISIEQETNLLDDYLQMEQTRFGFNYSIKVDEQIDKQIEIPAMLLQPFVENAVKHGISALKEKGIVNVTIFESSKDILLSVQDNGKGFSNQQTDGRGIKLCRERIELFNSIYKNTFILLHIKPADNGTLIIIELKNWL